MRSAALTSVTARVLDGQLARADGQEDLCFALWRPSTGSVRLSALISEPILPQPGERHVHGNASFEEDYFLRALGIAVGKGCGLALLHSHPHARGWQEMSGDDIAAEEGHAAQTLAMTKLPLVGLTHATGDGRFSARFWEKTAPRTYQRRDCATVRLVGGQLRMTYDERQLPRPAFREELRRTRSAWGEEMQADLARLTIGIAGLGSVGALVAESLARSGICNLRLIDFDGIERLNLDRIVHACSRDVLLHRSKVEASRRRLLRSATAADPQIDALELSIAEPEGYLAALNCDVLFSCVDRPWARHVLNFIAYTHLIPVVDGGIAVDVTRSGLMRGADWKAHVAAPGRRCLSCLGQYDRGLVQAEREGAFERPDYIKSLPHDHPIRRNENVFAFSMGCAGLELGQFLSMVVAPGGIADYGAQNYHMKNGTIDIGTDGCRPECEFSTQLVAVGDHSGFDLTGFHAAAHEARAARAAAQRRPLVRLLRKLNDLLGWTILRR